MLILFSIKLVKVKKVWLTRILGVEIFRDGGSNISPILLILHTWSEEICRACRSMLKLGSEKGRVLSDVLGKLMCWRRTMLAKYMFNLVWCTVLVGVARNFMGWISATTLLAPPLLAKNKVHSFFLELNSITGYHNTYILIFMNTHIQILLLWASLKDWAGTSRDSWSHHKHLVVDEDVAYH